MTLKRSRVMQSVAGWVEGTQEGPTRGQKMGSCVAEWFQDPATRPAVLNVREVQWQNVGQLAGCNATMAICTNGGQFRPGRVGVGKTTLASECSRGLLGAPLIGPPTVATFKNPEPATVVR